MEIDTAKLCTTRMGGPWQSLPGSLNLAGDHLLARFSRWSADKKFPTLMSGQNWLKPKVPNFTGYLETRSPRGKVPNFNVQPQLLSRTFFGTSTRSVGRLFRRNRTGISGIAFQFRRESKPVWLCSVSTALKKWWSRSRSKIRRDFEYRTGPSNFAMSDPAEIDYLQLRESGRGHLQPERSHAS